MAVVHFTPNLRRHVASGSVHVEGETVRAVFDAVFEQNPTLRGYVLDDQGGVRHHVNVFVNGEMIDDRRGLGDAVGPTTEIYVMQALSGG